MNPSALKSRGRSNAGLVPSMSSSSGVKVQVEEAAKNMRPMVGLETFVVPLQNGVEAPSH